MKTDELIFWTILVIVFVISQYVAWKRLIGGFLVVKAYKNYQGKYCSRRKSPLVVVLKNNSFREQVVGRIDFLDHMRNVLYSIDMQDTSIKSGSSSGIDVGGSELRFGNTLNPACFVRVMVRCGKKYHGKICAKRWYHI
ncbi:hypothetical protein [Microbulbifer sp. ALW1]|uniref:hypothetical protein n=1 Tax=Microbulbifer sp. (strain ALW1) TaxID=1516059 RepID=UPI0013574842|nr:hypothetical protein [Microbulbifer sp. ALW1]